MQPEMSPAPRNVEQVTSPAAGYSYESYPQMVQRPEVYAPAPHEQFEQRRAVAMEMAPPPPMPMPMQPMPMPVPPQPVQVARDVTVSGNPATADDDDIIEKEWVNRAKQVIIETRNDPRAREKAIGALQRDYLMKRYGKQLGATND